MKFTNYMVETITLRSTFVAATGGVYSLAKVGETLLRLPKAIVLTMLASYAIWFIGSVAIDSVLSQVFTRHLN